MTDGVSYEGVFGSRPEMAPQAKASMRTLGYAGRGVAAVDSLTTQSVSAETMAMPAPASPPALLREAPATEPKPQVQAGKGHAKIAPALQNLSEKLVGGNYIQGPVKVKDGWVEVFIYLTDDTPERLSTLQSLGVRILSHATSGKTVHARLKVTDLERVAEQDFVKRIEPPTF